MELKTDSLKHNWNLIQAVAKRKFNATDIFPVLKANAYGLGADNVVKQLTLQKICLSQPNELQSIQSGKDQLKEIFCLMPFSAIQHSLSLDTHAWVVSISSEQDLLDLTAKTSIHTRLAGVCVWVDTGLNRLGISVKDIDRLLALCLQVERIFPKLLVLGMHPKSNTAHSLQQELADLDSFHSLLCTRLKRYVKRSVSNSYSLFSTVDYADDMPRPGVSLYGSLHPGEDYASDTSLTFAASLTCSVLEYRGYCTPYGYSWSPTASTREPYHLYLLNKGYADGVPTVGKDIAFTLPNGVQGVIPAAGIFMNYCMLKVSFKDDVCLGDDLDLFKNNPASNCVHSTSFNVNNITLGLRA